MDEAYGDRYRQLYHRHWWWRAREAFLVRRLRELRPPEGFGPILDVGCGDGLFFSRLREFGEPEGVESEPSLVTSEGRSLGRIHIGRFGEIDSIRGPYGLVTLFDVLEHLHHPREALRTAASLLAPDGRIVVTVPAFRCLWTTHDDFNHHLVRYRRDQLVGLGRSAGLVEESCRYFFHWLFPVKLLFRALEIATGTSNMASVPRETVNLALIRMSLLEQHLFNRIAPPFGSSLFAVFSVPGRSP